MHHDMIKPFTILRVRDEVDGGKTVFFRVSKTVQVTDTRSNTKSMASAIHVNAGEDIDACVFNSLKESGWLNA